MRFFTIISVLFVLFTPHVCAFSALQYEGQEVENIQRTLRTLGYYSGICDGVYSKEVENAVLSWQADKGLPETGICTSYDLAALVIEEKTPLENEDVILALASYLYTEAENAPRIYKTALCCEVIRSAKAKNISVFDELSHRKAVYTSFDKECLRCAFEAFITFNTPTL